jgi:hypothetical protein
MVVLDLEDFTRVVIDKIETPGVGGDGEAF